MKTRKIFIFLSIMVLALMLSSCAGDSSNEPANMPDNGSDSGLPPVAAVKARELLAQTLGVDISQVEIVSQEQAEWSDSCLGLGGPAESCLAAIFPGWLVELSVKGETYFVRTDELGEIIRIEDMDPADVAGPIPLEPSEGDGPTPEAGEKARLALAEQLGISVNLVSVLAIEQTEWSDSCLGLGGPAESCLVAITPGWLVELTAEGESYNARSDELGDMIRFEGMDSTGSDGPIPEVAAKARQALAAKLGIDANEIEIVSFSKAEWPNGCLGLAGKDEMCTEAQVSGWRVELSVEGQSYIARTDESGDAVRFE